jgi:hypothetical protein
MGEGEMSNGLIDWSSEKGRALQEEFWHILMLDLLERRLVWLPRTCISCGSKTQPCCGH